VIAVMMRYREAVMVTSSMVALVLISYEEMTETILSLVELITIP
jgi:hypothetical protein